MLHYVATTLAQGGYGRGARIAIALPEGPELAVAIVATAMCASCAPLNPGLSQATLRHLLAAMRIDALIVTAGDGSAVVNAARAIGVSIIELGIEGAMRAGEFTLALSPRRPPAPIGAASVEDIALLMHTSGTTSLPKVVPLANCGLTEAARAYAEVRGLTHNDRVLLMAPLYNITGIRRNLLPALMLGGAAICPPAFDPERFVGWLEEFAPTHYCAAAATHIAVFDVLERHPSAIRHSLRFVFSGAAMLPNAVVDGVQRILGVPLLEGYGMTETGSIAQSLSLPRPSPRGSVGLPTNAHVAIMDDEGRCLGADEIGEIVVRGPEVFAGYENDPPASAAAFRDGWFRTGDLGRIDRDGFVFIAGRIKDVINRGGTKIAPMDVEQALTRHARVLEAAAFALPHPMLGEDVAAAVVLRDGATATEQELREFARGQLAPFQVPTRVIVVPDLPRGALGKVKRSELAAHAAHHDPTRFVAARTDVEAQVVRLFAEVLGVARIGVDDNFFQLGGDSLRASRVIARAEASFGVTIPITALFDRPTASELAALVEDARATKTHAAPPANAAIARRASRAPREAPALERKR